MGERFETIDMVLLLENYDDEGKKLHYSLLKAGAACLAIVLRDQDFLPEEVYSVYQLLAENREEKISTGTAKTYYEIPIPESWSMDSRKRTETKVTWRNEEKGQIHLRKDQTVEAVDWYDRAGVIRITEHYNRYGWISGKTVYDEKGRPVNKTWFSQSGKPVLSKNYFTGDVVYNDGEREMILSSAEEAFIFFMNHSDLKDKRIFYHVSEVCFHIIKKIEGKRAADVLFWRGDVRKNPEIMQEILNSKIAGANCIILQERKQYEQLQKLGKISPQIQGLGFIYPFERENKNGRDVLICTNSDHIEYGMQIIEELPELHFHIAALTAMSDKLLCMGQRENVSLYPGVTENQLDELFGKCDFYFDFNYGREIASAVYRAFLNNQLIFAFEETVHDDRFIAEEHLYKAADAGKISAEIRRIIADMRLQRGNVSLQQKAAWAVTEDDYRKKLF